MIPYKNNGASQQAKLRPSVRGGISVQELKKMTAQRIASNQDNLNWARPVGPPVVSSSMPPQPMLFAQQGAPRYAPASLDGNQRNRADTVGPFHEEPQMDFFQEIRHDPYPSLHPSPSRQYVSPPIVVQQPSYSSQSSGIGISPLHSRNISSVSPVSPASESPITPSAVAHGLTVQELKELTRMRLAREAGGGTTLRTREGSTTSIEDFNYDPDNYFDNSNLAALVSNLNLDNYQQQHSSEYESQTQTTSITPPPIIGLRSGMTMSPHSIFSNTTPTTASAMSSTNLLVGSSPNNNTNNSNNNNQYLQRSFLPPSPPPLGQQQQLPSEYMLQSATYSIPHSTSNANTTSSSSILGIHPGLQEGYVTDHYIPTLPPPGILERDKEMMYTPATTTSAPLRKLALSNTMNRDPSLAFPDNLTSSLLGGDPIFDAAQPRHRPGIIGGGTGNDSKSNSPKSIRGRPRISISCPEPVRQRSISDSSTIPYEMAESVLLTPTPRSPSTPKFKFREPVDIDDNNSYNNSSITTYRSQTSSGTSHMNFPIGSGRSGGSYTGVSGTGAGVGNVLSAFSKYDLSDDTAGSSSSSSSLRSRGTPSPGSLSLLSLSPSCTPLPLQQSTLSQDDAYKFNNSGTSTNGNDLSSNDPVYIDSLASNLYPFSHNGSGGIGSKKPVSAIGPSTSATALSTLVAANLEDGNSCFPGQGIPQFSSFCTSPQHEYFHDDVTPFPPHCEDSPAASGLDYLRNSYSPIYHSEEAPSYGFSLTGESSVGLFAPLLTSYPLCMSTASGNATVAATPPVPVAGGIIENNHYPSELLGTEDTNPFT